MLHEHSYASLMEQYAHQLHAVMLPGAGKALPIDLSVSSTLVDAGFWNDPVQASVFFADLRKEKGASFFYGGYRELRNIYSNFSLFAQHEEPRNLHLGMDVWADEGSPVYVPWGGMVHSFKFNDGPGDYGGTIILQHQLSGLNFYTLYGHLSLASLQGLEAGKFLTRGMPFAALGKPGENGNWPPHLHFQVILDIQHYSGDYPGVCTLSQAPSFLRNSPDPSYFFRFPA